jgi:hypothetical protein
MGRLVSWFIFYFNEGYPFQIQLIFPWKKEFIKIVKIFGMSETCLNYTAQF